MFRPTANEELQNCVPDWANRLHKEPFRASESGACVCDRACHELIRTCGVRATDSDLRMNRGKRVTDSRVRVTTSHELPTGSSTTDSDLGMNRGKQVPDSLSHANTHGYSQNQWPTWETSEMQQWGLRRLRTDAHTSYARAFRGPTQTRNIAGRQTKVHMDCYSSDSHFQSDWQDGEHREQGPHANILSSRHSVPLLARPLLSEKAAHPRLRHRFPANQQSEQQKMMNCRIPDLMQDRMTVYARISAAHILKAKTWST
ncbi:hypothetical protein BV25DRAFT_1842080 [Artomyces pyxidatus]|uniref:Uncharacterized protein n=1 Tax=Artomyces pyxidatus TaxID=48021 RepID=A0ACB8SLK4_9AGAM|nr:hypothetical protein BV25DRAFT_1842080 [Artomyces pyxidatus]